LDGKNETHRNFTRKNASTIAEINIRCPALAIIKAFNSAAKAK
jgi:hypothetical protein